MLAFYFSGDNWSFAVLDKHYFDKAYEVWAHSWYGIADQRDGKSLTREMQAFPALLFSVLAVALQFLPLRSPTAEALMIDGIESCDSLSQKFCGIGFRLMNLVGRSYPSLISVQHDLSRAIWLKNCSRGTEAWQSLGSAIR